MHADNVAAKGGMFRAVGKIHPADPFWRSKRSRLSAGVHPGKRGSIRVVGLSNGFSKKAENHAHSVAIHFMHYNFVRVHQSLRITPAMAAGVTPKLWSLTDMVRVIEDWEIARSLKISDKTMVG